MAYAYPDKYKLFSDQQTKNLNIVFMIDGLATKFSFVPTYTKVRYGDPGIYYGQPGLVYGSLRLDDTVKPWIMTDSSLIISQRLEPEQGRASVTQMSISLIDKDGEVSKIISPGGGVLDEILGRSFKCMVGYVQSSFPEDYTTVLVGSITNTQIQSGKVSFALGDPNQKSRQVICRQAKTSLSASVSPSDTTIYLNQTTSLYHPIAYSTAQVTCYIQIEDELISYTADNIFDDRIENVTRAQRNTTNVAHAINTEVTNAILFGPENPFTLALQVLLSGWNGPYKSGIFVGALGTQLDPTLPVTKNIIVLPSGKDAIEDYGLSVGDTVTVTGSTNGNDGGYPVTGFLSLFGTPNRGILIAQDLSLENPASTVTVSFRSFYDTLPPEAGLKLDASQVDVEGFKKIRDTYFSSEENKVEILVKNQTAGKDFIEKELLYAFSAYSLTRFGRLSCGYTRPPLPEQKLIELNYTNIVQPENITVDRGLNSRKFYNEIEYQYDLSDQGKYQKVTRTLDTDSLNKIGLVSLLPIKSQGVKAALGGGLLALRTARRLLTRYKNAAAQVSLKTFWGVGSQIEVGDIVLLRDEGKLQLTNFETGERNQAVTLYEVLDRSLNITNGDCSLKLVAGFGNSLNDRYATIAPSSKIAGVITTDTTLDLTFIHSKNVQGAEGSKWVDLIGLKIQVHDYGYTRISESVIKGFDPSNENVMLVDPPLAFIPSAGDIVELADYADLDPKDQELAKKLYAYFAKSVPIVSGTSNVSFEVDSMDAYHFPPGCEIEVTDPYFSVVSPEVKVLNTSTGSTINVGASLGFTPSSSNTVEGGAFKDGNGVYRLI